VNADAELRALAAHPLGWPLRRDVLRLAERARAGAQGLAVDALDQTLGPSSGVRFVEQRPKPRRRGRTGTTLLEDTHYDARIARHGEVPTRPGNAHDRMNALVWARFPRMKRAIHARQCQLVDGHLRAHGGRLPGARTREQDAVAMLDEGGVAILASATTAPRIERAVREHDDATVADAVARGQALGVLVGHALYEHLARGPTHAVAPARIGALAIVLPLLDGPAATLEDVDLALANVVDDPAELTHPDQYGLVAVDAAVLGVRA
jgi:hypothetical protein